jgi:DNA-binding LacI/PurR family transcriptional regulator
MWIRHRDYEGAVTMTLKDQGYRAQLADVARLAQVSRSTASKILNNVPSVSVRPETRQRVRHAAATLGYRPHVTARALAGVSARALALLVPDLTNPAHSEMVRGAFSEARSLGYTVLVAEDSEQQEADENFADLVAAGHVDGIVMGSAMRAHPLLPRLAEQGIPHVFMNRAVIGSGRNVTMDLVTTSWLAVDHLVGFGHKMIGHVAGPHDVDTSHTRATAFKAAAKARGVTVSPVRSSSFDEHGGAEAAAALLNRYPGLTAIYVSSLRQAVGVVYTLHQRRLHIPTDVSVITYDDLPLAAYLYPPLDTLAMPATQLGRAAVRLLIEQIEGRPPRDLRISDAPRLVVRGSVCSPRPIATE